MAFARSIVRSSERRNFDEHVSIRVYDRARLKSNELVLLDSEWSNQVSLFENGKYRLSLSGNERFDIDHAKGIAYSVSLYNHQHYVGNIHINRDGIAIDGIYELDDTRVAVHHTTQVDRRLHGTFKIELVGTGPIYRVDIKSSRSVWFGLFIFGRKLLTVRPNGDFFEQQLEELSKVVAKRAVENEKRTNKTSIGIQCMIEARPMQTPESKAQSSKATEETKSIDSSPKLSKKIDLVKKTASQNDQKISGAQPLSFDMTQMQNMMVAMSSFFGAMATSGSAPNAEELMAARMGALELMKKGDESDETLDKE